MQIRMRGGVDGGLEERLEEVLDDVLEAGDLVVQLVDVVQPRDLDQPQGIVRVNLVGDGPTCKLVPFSYRPT